MRKETPMISVWDGNILVDLFIHYPTATCPAPNDLEIALCRIFKEHKELKADIDRAKRYTGTEGYPCPLCEYKDGKFIRHCVMHAHIEQLKAELQEYKEIEDLDVGFVKGGE